MARVNSAFLRSTIDSERQPVNKRAKTKNSFVKIKKTPKFAFTINGKRSAKDSQVLRYRNKKHIQLPHVLKFSGGRSSGLLLFSMLENGILKKERGDVIIFNNTSCEHPETYKFVKHCSEIVEQQYGIPFFWVEYQTYEDARGGQWRRIPSYRLVNSKPFSEKNPLGFQWKGEAFEELLSFAGYVPNKFSRICTAVLKLETSRRFLKDWFAGLDFIPALGHHGETSRIEMDDFIRMYKASRGKMPPEILTEKKKFLKSRPYRRPKQYFCDYSQIKERHTNEYLSSRIFGDEADFGHKGIEYISLIGLRADEPLRVERVLKRNEKTAPGYEGEHAYMPLAELGIGQENVSGFWDKQHWDLKLDADSSLTNCVYCFLKGTRKLAHVHKQMEKRKKHNVRGFGSTIGTPCDINWWRDMEERYGRDMEAEGRERRRDIKHIGFFGADGNFTYTILHETNANDSKNPSVEILPCDCTD